jgi:hypothetical protein
MQFVVASERYVEFWRQPNSIQVGDFFVTISKKFADREMTTFLGNTYTQFTVMESDDLGHGQFRIKASSDKRLDFLDRGLLFAMGLTEQIVTLDAEGHISSLVVVKSVSSIVGGTGDLQRFENGLYKLQTIDDHMYQATLTEKRSGVALPTRAFLVFLAFLAFLVLVALIVLVCGFAQKRSAA